MNELTIYTINGMSGIEEAGYLDDFLPNEKGAYRLYLHLWEKIVYMELCGDCNNRKYDTLCKKYEAVIKGLGM